MTEIDVHTMWKGLIGPDWLRALDDTPFLARCRTGAVERREMLEFVVQHFHYARHFTRYLAALMASLEREDDRRELARNLFEELGYSGSANVSHAEIYRDMMRKMGIAWEGTAPLPETVELVRTMHDCCQSRISMVGLGAIGLGAEAIVPHVYSRVLQGFEVIGERPEHLLFFRLHVEEDDAHAETMYRIVCRELDQDPSRRIHLEYGARRALTARAGLFRALGSRAAATEREA
jgi:pyrroloquinoline quinone (PQQ) biosynthesis protein C